jgi:hypothetical protein
MAETVRIELTTLPPEGSALPLRYVSLVAVGGLEPPPTRLMRPLPCRWATPHHWSRVRDLNPQCARAADLRSAALPVGRTREIGRQGRTRTDKRLRAPVPETGVYTEDFTTCRWLPSDDSNIVSRINNPPSYRLDDRGSIGGTSRNRTDRTVLAKHRRRALVHAVPLEPPDGIEPSLDRIRNPVPFRLATGV